MQPSRPVLPAAAAGFALLAGCVQLEWHKDDVVAEQRDRDLAACTAEARAEAWRRSPLRRPAPVIFDTQGRAVAVQTQMHDDQHFLLEQDLQRSCMQARGYALREHPSRKP